MEVKVFSKIYLLKGEWKNKSTSLQYNMYIKGSMEVQEYKFTVNCVLDRSSSLHYNMYIKGSMEVQEYKFIVNCVLKRSMEV